MTDGREGEDRVQYAVLEVLGEWRIVRLGWRAERFESQAEAALEAVRLAGEERAQAPTLRIQILTEDVWPEGAADFGASILQ